MLEPPINWSTSNIRPPPCRRLREGRALRISPSHASIPIDGPREATRATRADGTTILRRLDSRTEDSRGRVPNQVGTRRVPDQERDVFYTKFLHHDSSIARIKIRYVLDLRPRAEDGNQYICGKAPKYNLQIYSQALHLPPIYHCRQRQRKPCTEETELQLREIIYLPPPESPTRRPD